MKKENSRNRKKKKRKRNILSKEVNRIDKVVFKIICLMLDIIFIYRSVEIVFDENMDINDKIKFIIITIIITVFVFGRVLNKNRSKAMKALRGYCTYKEALRLLENEEFERIEIVGEKLMVSKKWIYVFGTFVPKNLVVGFYKVDSGSVCIFLMLMNGRVIMYKAEASNYYPKESTNIFYKILKNGKDFSRMYFYEGKVFKKYKKEMKSKFDKELESGKTLEQFIKKFDESFRYENI